MKILQSGPDLFDLLDEQINHPLCKHGVGIKNGGYSLEHDTTSPYVGYWVHADEHCRRPSWMKEET